MNDKESKKSLSVILGAAFLMATSAIGPGFLTQTSTFTAKYMASFAFVIVCVIIMDIIAQSNVWSIIGASGLRGQEIANKVIPGLGVFLAVLVTIGGLAYATLMTLFVVPILYDLFNGKNYNVRRLEDVEDAPEGAQTEIE